MCVGVALGLVPQVSGITVDPVPRDASVPGPVCRGIKPLFPLIDGHLQVLNPWEVASRVVRASQADPCKIVEMSDFMQEVACCVVVDAQVCL